MSKTSSFLPPGFPFSAFSLTGDFYRPAPGLAPPRPPMLLDFVGIFLTFLYYPFEIAFSLLEGGRRFPGIGPVEIATAPPGQIRAFLSPDSAWILL